MNQFDAMRAAVAEARTTMQAADSVASEMARLVVGRLRRAGTNTLRDLKRELQDFDATRGVWKR
jgi:hypothetical protein